MKLSFWKMNGAGNDFVVVDNRDLSLNLSTEQIAQLCDRNRGVGADGLLAVEPAQSDGNFRFRYYNADGGEAEMCGNGARCFGAYVDKLGGETHEAVSFETIAGTLEATFHGTDVMIAMSDPVDLILGHELELMGAPTSVHSVNTGVPHAVVIVDDLAGADVCGMGAAIRYHDQFAPSGTNANLMEVNAPNQISIRTYERGVENETLACGTGMVAAAIIYDQKHGASSPVAVQVKGGDILQIGFEKNSDGSYTNVTLTGPADFVFQGEIEI